MSSFLATQHASFNFFCHFLKIIIAVFLYENVYLDCKKKIYLNWGKEKSAKESWCAHDVPPVYFPTIPRYLLAVTGDV